MPKTMPAIREQKLNEILLSLSNEIARMRGKEDMLHLIRNSLKQYIYFDDSFILRYNKDTKTVNPIFSTLKRTVVTMLNLRDR